MLSNSNIFPDRSEGQSESWIYGGAQDREVLDLDDDALRAVLDRDRERVFGRHSEPAAWFVQRWHEGLPHYDDEWPCYSPSMEVIEAEFRDGVLRPIRRLALRPGERVGIVLVRRPDPARWDLARLSKTAGPDERGLEEEGLPDWASALDREDQG